jgi:hypothetical protein
MGINSNYPSGTGGTLTLTGGSITITAGSASDSYSHAMSVPPVSGSLVRCRKELITLWRRDVDTIALFDDGGKWKFGELGMLTGESFSYKDGLQLNEVMVPNVGRRWVRSHEYEVIE